MPFFGENTMSYRDTVTKKKNAENRTYSQKALEKLAKGGYANEKKQTKEVPYVKPQVTSQRVQTTPVNTPKPTSNDENYVVKRDRYNKLMQDNRLANDIKTLATVNYSNANQDATVSQDWADTYGAKKITGGYTKQQFLDTLSRRYSLTPKELNDMALTFHSDATNAENERYGKELEQVGKKLPVLGSAGSFVGTLGSGIEGMYNTAVGGITGDDRYLSNMFRTTKNSPREGAKQNINSNIGKTIYDIGMGVGDMAAGAAAGSAPMLLAGNTANEAQASAMNRGSSVRKASAYAGAAGTVDYLTNTIGLEKAKKLAVNGIKSTGIKKILAQNAIAGAGEAGENLVQDIGQSFFDNLINGKNSELLYSYNNKKANGMSDEDAMKEVAKEYVAQLGVSAATGFGMGSAMQAGSTIANNIPELKADLGQFNMDNRGQVDIDALFGRRPDLQELVNRDPGSFDTTELATFSAKKKDVASLLKQKNAEIRVQEGVHENATKKTKNAEYEKLAALKNEAEELKLEKKIYDYASKGKALPVKDRLPLDMYNSIYGRQNGLMNHIGYANKIAGDTPESKQLAREVKQLVTKLVETGNMDVYKELGTKAEQLNDLAKANNKEYKGATYDNYFTDFDDNGNPIEHNLVDYIVDNSGVSKAIQKFHLKPTNIPEKTSKSSGETVAESVASTDGQLTPEEVAVLQDVVDGKYDIPENGNLPNSTKIPEYTMGEDVYFNGSDADIAQAEAQDQAIVDTFKNIIADPEFNALSFKNGSKEVFVSPATNGNGLRMSYTIDGVPTGHHDYSFDQLDELSRNLRNEAGNGGEDIKIQRKSDYTKNMPSNEAIETRASAEVPRLQMTENETGRSSFFPPEVSRNVPPNNGMPHVDGTMPGDKSKTSKTYTNTGKLGGGWNEAEYEKYTDESMFQYEPKAEQESFQEGYNMWQKEGREGFKDRVMDKERLSGAEIDGLMIEWRILAREARALEEAGQDAGDAWKESIKVFRKIQTQSSDNAQALQALAKWSRNTPEGMLSEAENIVNGKTREKKSELQKELEKFGKRNRKFQFSEDFVKEFLKDAEEIQKYPADSPMANMLMAKLGRKVSRQIPVKFGEKLTSFLMDNMLGNFRTLITRNAGGNVGLNAVEQLAQRPLAAGIDALASKKTGKRTQAGLSTEGLAEYIQGFSKGLKDEARDLRTGLHTARTGENTLERAITANRHVFGEGKGLTGNTVIGRTMDKWDSLIKNGLSVGDRPFYEAVYKQTLGDYHRLRNAGLMGPDVQKLDNDQFKQYAQTAAKLNALAAVYQGDTTLSKALLGFKRDIGNLSEGIVGVDILSQFSMPFVKTPANVVDVGISYSPLGLVRNAFRTGRELANDNFDQNRFANETSRNILGTLGTIGAMGLAKNGILSGGYSDDADEKQAQKEAGEQEYALSLGDKQMDIGWLPVVGSNAVAAAATQDAIENGEGGLLQNAMEGLYAGGKAMFDQSMFQGLQRLFGTGEAYDSDTGIAGNMVNVVKSGIGQGIPSLARQVGQVIDPYQRDMGYSNVDWEFGPFDNYDINSLVNNVPILRQNALAPKVNTSGELLKENQGRNVAMKVLEDMILPGKITKVEYSDLANEAMRLQAETNSADAYLPKAIRKNVDTDDYHLTNDEWVDYQQKYYKALTDVGTKIMQSESYQNADAETQTKTLKDAYDAVKSAINSEYNGKEVSGAAKKYVEAGGGKKGIDAVVNHFYAKQMMDDVGLSTSSNAGKEIAKAVESGDIKKAEELKEQAKNDTDYAKAIGYVDKEGNVRLSDYQKLIRKAGTQSKKMQNDLPVLHEMGLGNISHSVYHTYAEAIQKPANKNLDPREYATTFKKIDGADGTKPSESITQDELVAYFNKNNFSSEDQALKVWNVYAQGKKVPYLKKDGTWGTRMPK